MARVNRVAAFPRFRPSWPELSWIPTSTRLIGPDRKIEGLRKQLDDSSPEHELTRREKRRTIKTDLINCRHTIPRHWIFRVLGRMAIVVTAVFYVLVVFFAQYTSWGGCEQPLRTTRVLAAGAVF